MSVKAYKVEKLAKELSFKPNDLIECIFEDVGVIFYGDDDRKYFVWLDEEDMDELEEWLDKYKTGDFEDEDDEEEEFDEDEIELPVEEREYDFTEKDFRQAELIIKKIKQDLDKDGSVIYLFQ
jgi:hypothetical protein